MSSRWDRLLDLKTLTLVDALMAEASKVLAEELLGSFPPPVEGLDLAVAREFSGIFAPDAEPPPAIASRREAIRLARWDLAREFDAFDDYIRNRRYREHGLEEEHRTAVLFLCRWLVEQMLTLGDSTNGRVTRKDMLAGLDRLEALLLPA